MEICKSEPYIINENICTAYEKTFICSIADYLRLYPASLSADEWEAFCLDYSLQTNIVLRMHAETMQKEEFDYSEIAFIDDIVCLQDYHFHYKLVESLIYFRNIRDLLRSIKSIADIESAKDNFSSYQSMIYLLTLLNVNSGTFESIKRDKFSKGYTPQSFTNFDPHSFLNFIQTCIMHDDIFKSYKDLLSLVYQIFNHEIQVHINSMYFIISMQMIKWSQFYETKICKIADDLYNILIGLLRDSRIVMIQYSNGHLDNKIPIEARDKKDNTTRLHIVYGYDNFDLYSIRFDAAHKGINWFHFNNESPGEVKYFPIDQSVYEKLMVKIPETNKCFINYGSRYWFLRENYKDTLSSNNLDVLESLLYDNMHQKALSMEAEESDIVSFFEFLNNYLYAFFPATVDNDGEQRDKSFLHEKYFFYGFIFLVAILNNCSKSRLDYISSFVLEKAQTQGLISVEEMRSLETESNEFAIEYIINQANDIYGEAYL